MVDPSFLGKRKKIPSTQLLGIPPGFQGQLEARMEASMLAPVPGSPGLKGKQGLAWGRSQQPAQETHSPSFPVHLALSSQGQPWGAEGSQPTIMGDLAFCYRFAGLLPSLDPCPQFWKTGIRKAASGLRDMALWALGPITPGVG